MPIVPLVITLLVQAGFSGCAPTKYTGVSGINGYHASLTEARQYWRAKGYEFGSEATTVPRMEELAALYTPPQWANRVTRHTNTRNADSDVDIDETSSIPDDISTSSRRVRQSAAPLESANVPPPIRKPLPPLE